MRGRGVVVLAVALTYGGLLTACGGSGSSGRDDQAFLHLTAYSDALSAVDIETRIDLGHRMCDLLDENHGDAQAADAEFAQGHEDVFTPSVVADLRDDATVAYCPQYR